MYAVFSTDNFILFMVNLFITNQNSPTLSIKQFHTTFFYAL